MIPFRPHHSWWVQLLLLGWHWLGELVLLGLLAGCQYAQPSPVGTNCVHYGRNPIPTCY